MRTILMPTDFSPNAVNALEYLTSFIGREKCNLHILNVVNPDVTPPDIIGSSSNLLGIQLETAKATMKTLEEKTSNTLANLKNVNLTTSVDVGNSIHTINKKARETEADMIVMGSRGQGHNLSEKIFGTISSEIISNPPCPVLLIPKDYKFQNIDNIVFATDLSAGDPYELWKAAHLLRPHVVQVRCVHVVEKEEEKYTKKVEQFAKYMINHSPTYETIFHLEVSDDVESTLANYVDNYDADVLVMHKSKKTLWNKIFGESHTKKMISETNVPLLILGFK